MSKQAIEDCTSEWVWKDCEIAGHEVECYRQVCPDCGDTMYRDCDDNQFKRYPQ